MHFGYFTLMGYRERGTPTRQVLREAAEQVEAADEVGFEYAWFAEHHFSNYCVCPSPLMMVAHLARTTRRIKLAPAVVVAPLYHPLRLLGEIGLADSLCDGRLVLGVGSGYQPFEFDRFGIDLADSKEMMEEFLDLLTLAFTQETFTFAGKHYRFPETAITAQTVNGVPEIWIAGDNPVLHRLAARRGYVPLFTGRVFGSEYQEKMRALVDRSYAEEGVAPEHTPLGVQRYLCVTSNRRETLDYVDNVRHQSRLASNLRRREQVTDGSMMIEQPFPDEPSLEQIADKVLVGDCETIAERLCEEIRRARPSHVMFHCQVGGSGHTQAMHTIERFATDIQPMLERELGPLAALGPPLPVAA
ncbi:MAG: LLM class flavin-dependent oxidoreductase [Gammaproteobacteria bacterium]